MFYIGTSGFIYSFWKGKFYPDDLPKSKWLEYYVNYFNTLELNSTFYKLPKESTIKSWKYKQKKYNLTLSIKANRAITHTSKLRNINSLNKFLNLLSPLNDYIGAILFQLPPSLRYDYSLLENFLNNLKNYKFAIEFRHKSWYNDKVFNLLNTKNIALVWHDFNQPFVIEKTADFSYIRFHGYLEKYKGSYPDEFLDMMINKSNNINYIYFNNTDDVSAPNDAIRLKKKIEY